MKTATGRSIMWPVRARRLLLLALLAPLLALLTHAPSARAEQATWAAWSVTVKFVNQSPRVIYTAYVGTNTPTPAVLGANQVDISTNCVVVGKLSYIKTAAIFNGTSYIRCQLPSWRTELQTLAPYLPMANNNATECRCGGAPLYGAASVQLPAQARANPIFSVPDLDLTLSVPSDGVTARTRLKLGPNVYRSPAWSVGATYKRTLTGMNGPAIVTAANHFGWLGFLSDQSWKPFFATQVTGARVGHWLEGPTVHSRQQGFSYGLATQPQYLYIGYDPLSGRYLKGQLTVAQIDPGCDGNI